MSTKKKIKKNVIFITGVIIFLLGFIPAAIGISLISNSSDIVSVWGVKHNLETPEWNSERMVQDSMSAYSYIGIDEDAYLKSEFRRAFDVDVIYVSEQYDRVYDIDTIRGRWLDVEDADLFGAVIDENTAFLLYGTYDCVGQEFDYLGTTYNVAGITKSKSIFHSNSKSTAYLMFKENRYIDYFGIAGNPSISEDYSYKMLSEVAQTIYTYSKTTVYNNLLIKHKSILIAKLLLLPLFIVFLVWSYRAIKRLTQKRFNYFKELLYNYYFEDKMWTIIINSIAFLLVSALWVMFLWFVYNFYINSIYYLEQFFPISLVDMTAIKNSITEAVFAANAPQVYKPSDVLAIYWGDKIFRISFALFYMGGLVVIYSMIKSAIKKMQKSK